MYIYPTLITINNNNNIIHMGAFEDVVSGPSFIGTGLVCGHVKQHLLITKPVCMYDIVAALTGQHTLFMDN